MVLEGGLDIVKRCRQVGRVVASLVVKDTPLR
jgi:hypothetical protein